MKQTQIMKLLHQKLMNICFVVSNDNNFLNKRIGIRIFSIGQITENELGLDYKNPVAVKDAWSIAICSTEIYIGRTKAYINVND